MYVKEKLISGYQGKFVVHDHYSNRAPHHFDLRLEFPVTSLPESLTEYHKKRDFDKTPEPESNGGSTVLRSWAIPKHAIPTNKPLLAHETEDHTIEYGSFHGTIPSGYGAGTVKIYDHGTFTFSAVKYDKKYVINFHGKKLHGLYSLIKMSGKNFLWGKVKNKEKYLKMASRIVQKFLVENPPL
jgi:hypothetical protein